MADMIKLFKGQLANLPAEGVNGGLYITTDEGAIYLGTGNGMKRLGDFIQVSEIATLPSKANESSLYYCVKENVLAKWNGSEWTQINKQRTDEAIKALAKGVAEQVLADAGIASNEVVSALAGRVTVVEGKVDVEKVSTAIESAITELDLANTYETKGEAAKVESKLTAYQTANDQALAAVKATAEAAYVKPETGIAKADLASDVQASLGLADSALQAADIADLAVKADVEAELAKKVDNTAYEAKVKEINDAIALKADESSVATRLADKVDVSAYNTKMGEIDAACALKATKVELAEGLALKVNSADYDVKVQAIEDELALKAVASEVATALEGKVDKSVYEAKVEELAGNITSAGEDALESAKTYVDNKFTDANLDQYTTEQEVKTIVDTVIANAVADDTITGLANLVEYLATHGAEAAEMGAAIDVLEGQVEDILAQPCHSISAQNISDWNNEVGAKAAAASALSEAVAELDGKITAAGTAASNALTEAVNAINAEVALKANSADVYTKTEVDAMLAWGSF